MSRSLPLRAWGLVLAYALPIAACAANGTATPAGASGPGGGGPGDTFGGDTAGGGDGAAERPQRCDDAGRCTCFNIASIGLPGHTGFQGGGTDTTTAFTDWLNTQSSAGVDLYEKRPTLNAAFLAKYDVLIVQWLVDGVSGEDGTGYWTFTPNELQALKTWVEGGGGIITLSGYDAQAEEVTPLNQLVQAVTDLSYGTADVLGTVSASNYCLGESDPLSGWVPSSPIGKHIDEVGVFHGRPILVGPKGTVDCANGAAVYAAHEDVGKGHVFAFTDEWVTYTSQWYGIDAGGGCEDASANVVYQVPQFWYNAISYASQATRCMFTIANSPIVR
jgi:hypothetical protein